MGRYSEMLQTFWNYLTPPYWVGPELRWADYKLLLTPTVGETGFSALAGMTILYLFGSTLKDFASWRAQTPYFTQRSYRTDRIQEEENSLKAWSWRCCAETTVRLNFWRCPVMRRGVFALLFLLRRSWGRMGTAQRTALHLLPHAPAANQSHTQGDPNPRSHTSLSLPWLSGTPLLDAWLWRK